MAAGRRWITGIENGTNSTVAESCGGGVGAGGNSTGHGWRALVMHLLWPILPHSFGAVRPAAAEATELSGVANCTVAEAPSRQPLLLSAATHNGHGMVNAVVENHRSFAAAHGYRYWWHAGNLAEAVSGQKEVPMQPYWTKVAMLRQALGDPGNAATDYAVWVDDDVVLTAPATDAFAAALSRLSSHDLLVTADPMAAVSKLNTGVVIVRNTLRARELLDELWRRASAPRADGLDLGGMGQRHCLHEQQALEEMVADGWAGVAVLPQRDRSGFNLNTFLRWSHFAPDGSQRHFDDPQAAQWRPGDAVGHCSGLSPARRGLCLAVLLAEAETAA
jgi:hypothetical protein